MKLQKFEVTHTTWGKSSTRPAYAENYRDAVYDGRKLETQVPWDGNYGKWLICGTPTTLELRRIRRPKWLKIVPVRTNGSFCHMRAYKARHWDPTKRTAIVRDDKGAAQRVNTDSGFRVVGKEWQERRAKEWCAMQLNAVLRIQQGPRWMSIRSAFAQHERAVNQRFISSLFKRAF